MTQESRTLQTQTPDEARWRAVQERDKTANGLFYYSVRTTGVYCRPSCGARTPKRENVAFHETAADAQNAGFRPCRRCRPDRPEPSSAEAAIITRLCRQIAASDSIPSLGELAAVSGWSWGHVQHVFRSATGLTPHQYAMAHREARLRQKLKEAGTVTEAIYDSGYNSNSRFYEQSNRVLGMSPTAYRSGGVDMEIKFAVGQCSLGAILVASTSLGVCAILMGDDPEPLLHDLQDRFPHARLTGGDAEFERLVAAVIGVVEAPQVGLDLPLDIRGTVFQQRVWNALRQIPPGSTSTYTEIAARIGAPKSVRAVAGACAANPLAVVIPCHRVIRTDGDLSGYRWGIERKRELLRRER